MDTFSADSTETRQLLERVRSGDTESLNRVFARYRDRLLQIVALQIDPKLRARVDASDVVQEAQIEATRRLPKFLAQPPMPFRLWLRKLTHERLLDTRRRHTAARRTVHKEMRLPDQTSLAIARQLRDSGSSPSRVLDRRELAQRVQFAIDELPTADRRILLMRYFEGLSYEEIACVLDVEPAVAMKRQGRAVLRLQRILRDFGLRESQV